MLPFEPDCGEGALQRDEEGCGEHLWRNGADGEGPADEKNAVGEEICAGKQDDIGQAEQPDAAGEHAHGAVEGGICGKQNAERGIEGEDGEAKGRDEDLASEAGEEKRQRGGDEPEPGGVDEIISMREEMA